MNAREWDEAMEEDAARRAAIQQEKEAPPVVINRHHHKDGYSGGPVYYVGRVGRISSEEILKGAKPLMVLANQFTEGDVIRSYRRWLYEETKNRRGAVYEAIKSIPCGARLACSCAPRPCHADVIVSAWEWIHDKPKTQAKRAAKEASGQMTLLTTPPRAALKAKKVEKCAGFSARIDGRDILLENPNYPGDAAVAAVRHHKAKYKTKPSRHWAMKLGDAGKILAMSKKGYVTLGDEIKARLEEEIERQSVALVRSRAHEAETIEGYGENPMRGFCGDLMPFQTGGVAYTLAAMKGRERTGVIIADDMGLGKTVQALAVLHVLKVRRAVVVPPSIAKINWLREANRFLEDQSVVVANGRKPSDIPKDTTIVVVNYDILEQWADTLKKWTPSVVVFDESQYLKNSKAKRTKAALKLSKSKGLRLNLLLSGTPVLKGPYDLISQLRIAGRLDDMGGGDYFRRQYCGTKEVKVGWDREKKQEITKVVTDHAVGKNLHEMNEKMRRLGIMVRRLKVDVLKDLPEKRRARVPIEIKAGPYSKILKAQKAELLRARMERVNAEKEGRPVEGWASAAAMVAAGELQRAILDAKLSPCISWIKDMLETGEKLVIFAHHVAAVERIAEELGAPMIRGGVTGDRRQEAIDRFQNDEDCRAIVVSIQAGKTAITLTASSNLVFVEKSFVPADNSQAEDRGHRIGQKRAVTIWLLEAVTSDGGMTWDTWQADLLAKRSVVVDAATDGVSAGDGNITEELAAMIEGE
jgi:SWI/SNF-related matrix-associated actin-dependent regulator 1 of chromatin subfamily A